MPSTPRTCRRWYQFSLRTLLVGMVVFCVTVGAFAAWGSYRRHQAKVNRDRVKAVEQAIAWIEESGGLYEATTKTLRSQTWLEELFDDPGGVDDPTVVVVVSSVHFGKSSHVTNKGLAHLEGLTSLEMLILSDTRITDAGLEHLKGLTSLRRLDLDGTQVTDAGMAHLKGLSSLRVVFLQNTRVTGAGFERLKGLNNVIHIDLSDTQLTDAGLKGVRAFTNLEYLYLANTEVTDAGLEHLKGLVNLQFLYAPNTQVTAGGANELHRALPRCEIKLIGLSFEELDW